LEVYPTENIKYS